MAVPYIVIAGNIGVGKSRLCVALADRMHAQPEVEDVGQNPHFRDFYADPGRWAFSSQLAFAAEAAGRHIRAQSGSAVIMDRSIHEGVAVFARLLASRNQISRRQLDLLDGFSGWIGGLPRQPQALVYLTSSPELLLERVKGRARPGEECIDIDYLKTLNTLYDEFIETWDCCPVLRVDAEARDLRVPEEITLLMSQLNGLVND